MHCRDAAAGAHFSLKPRLHHFAGLWYKPKDCNRAQQGHTAMAGENLDLSSDPPAGMDSQAGGSRRFLGIHFACCGVYARVYVNREGTEYVGRCPRCLAQARFVIGENGASGRFYSVS
jgi:hypothetical protein